MRKAAKCQEIAAVFFPGGVSLYNILKPKVYVVKNGW